MAKFKVGDKVKIVKSRTFSGYDRIGKVVTITRVGTTGFDEFIYDVDGDSMRWFEDELELVSLTIEEKREKLLEYCHGRICGNCKLYNYRCGFDGWSHRDTKVDKAYSIVFEQGEKDMKKEFTKKDLKNGDVVKFNSGEIGIVCVDTGAIIAKDGFWKLSYITDDLKHRISNSIVAVRRPNDPGDCSFVAFANEFGTLVYERKEVEEMTLEEVCKALGKEIKIVKK